MSGVLGPGVVAERFRDIFLSEESGTLEVRSGSLTSTFYFNQGLTVGARGGAPLSEYLVSCGAVTGTALSEAQSTTADGDDTVRMLVARGAVTAEAVAEGAMRHASQVIAEAFACKPDGIDFKQGSAPAGDLHGDLLRTVEAFIAGVGAIGNFAEIQQAMLSTQQPLVLRPNPSVPLEHLALKPLHGFVLSRLDGSLTFSEIASTLPPTGEAEAARFIFALLLLGSVVLDPPLGPGLFRTELLLAAHRRDEEREREEIDSIRETYAALQSQNPYQILGIAETARPEEIQTAYRDRRKALASDRFLERVRERMGSELKTIEARVNEAFLAVQRGGGRFAPREDPSEEIDIASLGMRRELVKTEVAATHDEQERLAEQYYLMAKKYFSQADYYNCIQYGTLAVKHSGHTARYHMLLGDAQARNPDHRWQKMAERSFLQASELDPWNADYLVVLGQFYKRQGLKARARRQFERAIELQPNHPKALEELATS